MLFHYLFNFGGLKYLLLKIILVVLEMRMMKYNFTSILPQCLVSGIEVLHLEFLE